DVRVGGAEARDQVAPGALARNEDVVGGIAAVKRGVAPVEPKPALLMFGAVALVAVLREEGLDLGGEVDGILGGVLTQGRSQQREGDDEAGAGLHAWFGPRKAVPLLQAFPGLLVTERSRRPPRF